MSASGTETDKRERVRIFDTTLRDGEQAPGFSMDHDQKLRMATALARLGVDIIEAGFPAASEGDFRAVLEIAEAVGQSDGAPVICGLARATDNDIRRTAEAIAPARRRRIHTFIATSPIHRERKLAMSKSQVLDKAVAAVTLAKGLCDEVEFSAEDALRTEPDYLAEVAATAVEAGASTINIPDTVGYATPEDIYAVFSMLRGALPGHVILSAHCHDDLGMAVANSLAAVRAGARQVECAMNGIGERAGNCALEEIAMAIRTRAGHYGVDTGIETEQLMQASRLLAGITGNAVPRNKAIVGENAFAHESGIHQDGVLKDVTTYEIMRPEDVGAGTSQLVLGKHSGRHAFARRAAAMGHNLAGDRLDEAFRAFKALADRKKTVTDADIDSLIMGREAGTAGPWQLVSMQVSTGTGETPLATAAIVLRHEHGKTVREAALGNGPLDAAFNSIKRATKTAPELADFSVRSIGAGADAQGWSDVRLAMGAESMHGSGVDTDIVIAAAQAYLDALNRLLRQQSYAASAGARTASSATRQSDALSA